MGVVSFIAGFLENNLDNLSKNINDSDDIDANDAIDPDLYTELECLTLIIYKDIIWYYYDVHIGFQPQYEDMRLRWPKTNMFG